MRELIAKNWVENLHNLAENGVVFLEYKNNKGEIKYTAGTLNNKAINIYTGKVFNRQDISKIEKSGLRIYDLLSYSWRTIPVSGINKNNIVVKEFSKNYLTWEGRSTSEDYSRRESVLNLLLEHDLEIVFVKSDGSIREMTCSKKNGLDSEIDESNSDINLFKGKSSTKFPIAVFDYEIGEKRQFVFERLIKYRKKGNKKFIPFSATEGLAEDIIKSEIYNNEKVILFKKSLDSGLIKSPKELSLDEIRNALKSKIVRMTFLKSDGNIFVVFATRNKEIIKKYADEEFQGEFIDTNSKMTVFDIKERKFIDLDLEKISDYDSKNNVSSWIEFDINDDSWFKVAYEGYSIRSFYVVGEISAVQIGRSVSDYRVTYEKSLLIDVEIINSLDNFDSDKNDKEIEENSRWEKYRKDTLDEDEDENGYLGYSDEDEDENENENDDLTVVYSKESNLFFDLSDGFIKLEYVNNSKEIKTTVCTLNKDIIKYHTGKEFDITEESFIYKYNNKSHSFSVFDINFLQWRTIGSNNYSDYTDDDKLEISSDGISYEGYNKSVDYKKRNKVLELLDNNIVELVFTKADGSVRRMFASRQGGLNAEVDKTLTDSFNYVYKTNGNIPVSVFDLQKKEERRFVFERLLRLRVKGSKNYIDYKTWKEVESKRGRRKIEVLDKEQSEADFKRMRKLNNILSNKVEELMNVGLTYKFTKDKMNNIVMFLNSSTNNKNLIISPAYIVEVSKNNKMKIIYERTQWYRTLKDFVELVYKNPKILGLNKKQSLFLIKAIVYSWDLRKK